MRKTQAPNLALLGGRQPSQLFVETAIAPYVVKLCSYEEANVSAAHAYETLVGGVVCIRKVSPPVHNKKPLIYSQKGLSSAR